METEFCTRVLQVLVTLLVAPEVPCDPFERLHPSAAVRSHSAAGSGFTTQTLFVRSAETVVATETACAGPPSTANSPLLFHLDRVGTPSVLPNRDLETPLLYEAQRYLALLQENRQPPDDLAESWDGFYRLYHPMISRTVAEFCVSAADRDDCIQEVWAELAAKLVRFEFDERRGTFCSWLRTVVRRKVMDCQRRWEPSCGRRLDIDLAASPCPRALEPAGVFEQNELRESLQAALADFRTRVPDTSYLVFQYCAVDGRSAPEVAVLLGLTPEQIWYRHHRMKRKFAVFLRARSGGPLNIRSTDGVS